MMKTIVLSLPLLLLVHTADAQQLEIDASVGGGFSTGTSPGLQLGLGGERALLVTGLTA